MFPLAALVVCVCAATAHAGKPYYNVEDAHNLFEDFLREHHKQYNPKDYVKRFHIFTENLKDINALNARHEETTFALNRFADLTSEEFKNSLGLNPMDDSIESLVKKVEYLPEEMTAPEQFNWKDKGVVTWVKDQGPCGSCWIFSAIGNIEGQYAIKNKKLVILAEQQSLDCLFPDDGNSTCHGGFPHEVMFYHTMRGVMKDDDYKYKYKPGKCRENETLSVAHVKDVQILKPADEETLKELLYKTGPLSVALDATDLQYYESGVLKPQLCKSKINHAVVLVGYGVEKGLKYWIVKNSWGEYWGEKGYFKLERGVKACAMGTSYTATCTLQ